MYAKEIMRTDVIRANSETSVYELINLMVEKNIAGITIVDSQNCVVGFVTENDLIYHKKLPVSPFLLFGYGNLELKQMPSSYREKLMEMRAKDLITSPVFSVTEDISLTKIAELMGEKRIKQLPVLRNSKLIGIIDRRDVLKEIFRLLL